MAVHVSECQLYSHGILHVASQFCSTIFSVANNSNHAVSELF